MTQRGMTLVELLIAAVLLIGVVSALLSGMEQAMVHTEYLSQFQVAVNATQGALEVLQGTDFDTLWVDAQANPTGRQQGLVILPGGILAVQIRNADLRNPTNPALLDLHVAACWQFRSRQIGDANCQGGIGPGGWVNSPVMVSTRVARSD